jgi:hypothetical protein
VSELKGGRSRQSVLKPSQCLLWNRILAVLEMLQVKKEISGIHLLIAPLFDLLKICLDEEEQVPLEYSKQLILSCLLSCCQKLPQGAYIYLLSICLCGIYLYPQFIYLFKQVIALNLPLNLTLA